jgi:hypothetical protein
MDYRAQVRTCSLVGRAGYDGVRCSLRWRGSDGERLKIEGNWHIQAFGDGGQRYWKGRSIFGNGGRQAQSDWSGSVRSPWSDRDNGVDIESRQLKGAACRGSLYEYWSLDPRHILPRRFSWLGNICRE